MMPPDVLHFLQLQRSLMTYAVVRYHLLPNIAYSCCMMPPDVLCCLQLQPDDLCCPQILPAAQYYLQLLYDAT